LNYTYATLPAVVPAQFFQPGSPQQGTPENDRIVQQYFDLVNKQIQLATLGNVKLESITFVRDIKQADVVIDLGTIADRAGFAIPQAGSGTGAQGALNLYYNMLAKNVGDPNSVGRRLTPTHELCHYFFGLPDEYSIVNGRVGPPQCPISSGGPVCLMDNYLQYSWSGKLCTGRPGDHNPNAPNQVFIGSAADPCLELVRRFVTDKRASWSETADAAAVASTAPKDAVPPGLVRRVASRLRRLPDASEILKLKAEGKPIDDVNQRILRQLAEGVFRTVAKDALDVAPPPVKIAERVVEFLLNDPLTADVIDKLRQEAVKVAGKVVGEDTADRIDRVNSLLIKFLRENKIADSPTADTKEVVRNIASDAVTGRDPLKLTASSQDKKERKPTVIFAPAPIAESISGQGPDKVKTQAMDLDSYERLRLDGVRQFKRLSDRDKVQIYLPLRATGADIEVGLNPADDYEILKISKFNQSEKSKDLESRKERVVQVFRELSKAIDDKKLENITLLVPPGGLDPSVEDEAKKLSDKVSERTDIRFDIGLVGTATISPLLRDLSHLTTGSVLTITDIDEVGAVAQRLAYEQTQGNWVIIPEQGRIDIPASQQGTKLAKAEDELHGLQSERKRMSNTDAKALEVADAKIKAKKAEIKPLKDSYDQQYEKEIKKLEGPKDDADQEAAAAAAGGPRIQKTLYERLANVRVRHRPWKLYSNEFNRQYLVLQPFYVDGTSSYELIVGLSQPLPNLDFVGKDPRYLPRIGFKIGKYTNEEGRKEIEENRGQWFEALEEDLTVLPDLSTNNVLVFQLKSLDQGGLGEGWYTPVLKVYDDLLASPGKTGVTREGFNDDFIHYTFSVGTLNPSNQVVASLVQEIPKDKDTTAYRGTLAGSVDTALIQAQVRAGLPIKNAVVTGFAERIEENSNSPIRRIAISLLDNGAAPDQQAGDGIYTVKIGLSRDVNQGAEYRVFVDAQAVSDPRFVPTGDKIQDADSQEDGSQTGGTQDIRAPRFERATSVQFRVMPKVN